MSLRVLGLFVCVEPPPRVYYMVQICLGFQFEVSCMWHGVTQRLNRVDLSIGSTAGSYAWNSTKLDATVPCGVAAINVS
jgi:hypothetical protein